MKKIIPVGQKILVEHINASEETLGSIVIAASTNAELAKGIVKGVSPFFKDVYKVGDTVLYIAKAGVSCISENKPHLLLDGGNGSSFQGDILAILEEV